MPYMSSDGEEMFEVEITLKRTLKNGDVQTITGKGIVDAKDAMLNSLSARGWYGQQREKPANPTPPGTSMAVTIQNYRGALAMTHSQQPTEKLSTPNDTIR